VPYGSYGTDTDWNNPDHVYTLNYSQDQGRRIFYQHCVWCHSDTTPAGPSNRSNVSPDPPLMNDSALLSKVSDASLHKIIASGGRGVGKSAMMPPYGATLSEEEINDVVAYIRVIAAPESSKSAANAKSRGSELP
jgi:mono/diheme cytochrome c family protein